MITPRGRATVRELPGHTRTVRLAYLTLVACSFAAPALAAPAPAWRDTTELDALAGDLASISTLLGSRGGPIDCPTYARISGIAKALPARIAAIRVARARIVEPALKAWLASHEPALEQHITLVVARLRRDQACPAILADDAAHLAGSAVAVLAGHDPERAVNHLRSICAADFGQLLASYVALLVPDPGAPATPLGWFARELEQVELVRHLDRTPDLCPRPFGGKPTVSGSNLDL